MPQYASEASQESVVMARKRKRNVLQNVPIHHGLTKRGATSVCNALIRLKRREGFKAKISKRGKLRFTKVRRKR